MIALRTHRLPSGARELQRPPSTTASRDCSVAPCRCPRSSVNDVAARTADYRRGWTRTTDDRVMSPATLPLVYPAACAAPDLMTTDKAPSRYRTGLPATTHRPAYSYAPIP